MIFFLKTPLSLLSVTIMPPEPEPLIDHLRSRLTGLLAIYAFGSRVQGTATAESDLDLAVPVEGYVGPLQL